MHRQTRTHTNTVVTTTGNNNRLLNLQRAFEKCTPEKEGNKSKIVDAHNTKRRTAKLCAHEKSHIYRERDMHI